VSLRFPAFGFRSSVYCTLNQSPVFSSLWYYLLYTVSWLLSPTFPSLSIYTVRCVLSTFVHLFFNSPTLRSISCLPSTLFPSPIPPLAIQSRQLHTLKCMLVPVISSPTSPLIVLSNQSPPSLHFHFNHTFLTHKLLRPCFLLLLIAVDEAPLFEVTLTFTVESHGRNVKSSSPALSQTLQALPHSPPSR
jgi:hypothetical protein